MLLRGRKGPLRCEGGCSPTGSGSPASFWLGFSIIEGNRVWSIRHSVSDKCCSSMRSCCWREDAEARERSRWFSEPPLSSLEASQSESPPWSQGWRVGSDRVESSRQVVGWMDGELDELGDVGNSKGIKFPRRKKGSRKVEQSREEAKSSEGEDQEPNNQGFGGAGRDDVQATTISEMGGRTGVVQWLVDWDQVVVRRQRRRHGDRMAGTRTGREVHVLKVLIFQVHGGAGHKSGSGTR